MNVNYSTLVSTFYLYRFKPCKAISDSEITIYFVWHDVSHRHRKPRMSSSLSPSSVAASASPGNAGAGSHEYSVNVTLKRTFQ